jgi:hypothetical protein
MVIVMLPAFQIGASLKRNCLWVETVCIMQTHGRKGSKRIKGHVFGVGLSI